MVFMVFLVLVVIMGRHNENTAPADPAAPVRAGIMQVQELKWTCELHRLLLMVFCRNTTHTTILTNTVPVIGGLFPAL